ncbi:TPA: hypothetical protein DHW58_00340 [Patescibacteria group bacterium]|nr:hypothetical protein [Patescibacteria group bacterium]
MPLEGSAYDYTTADSVYVFVLVAGGQSPVIDGVYKLSATRQVVGLPQIAVLAGRVYDVWVKPAQHLAVVASFIGGSSAVNVTTQPTALIGDIDFIRDNTINALDFAVFQQEYARTPVFGDFNHNTFVDALDFVFLFNNFFESGQRRPGT